MHIDTLIADMLPALHADGVADLTFWEECELITWADAALKRISRLASIFVRRDTSTALVAGTATYSAPARHLSTIHVQHNNKSLIASSTHELEGKDDAFLTTAGTPTHWYPDKIGANKIGLYKIPDAAAAAVSAALQLPIIYHEYPNTLDCGKATATVMQPAIIDDYCYIYTIGEAYAKQGDAQMPEVSQQLGEFRNLFESVLIRTYGEAQ